MPRPQKCRRVCHMPEYRSFRANNDTEDIVVLLVEEYESIRLIDLEGLSQEEASVSMNVARTTVQAIYTNARKKLADVLVNGKRLVIDGGNYELSGHCPRCRCKKQED